VAELLPTITERDVMAVRMLLADPAHTHALRWIMDQACRRLDSPYVPGNDATDTGVLMGRQIVGIWIGNMTSDALLEKAKADDERRRVAAIAKTTGLPATEAGKLVDQVRAKVTSRPRIHRKRPKE
jgi:hypothetical protein